MGAEFVGYTLCGPQSLNTRLRARALKQAQQVIDCGRALDAAGADDDVIKQVLHKYRKWLKHLGPVNDDVYEDLIGADIIDAQKTVDGLFAVWSGAFRDAALRMLHRRLDGKPLRPAIKLVVAGDQTWGDDPSGASYRVLKHADLLGLFDVFNIF